MDENKLIKNQSGPAVASDEGSSSLSQEMSGEQTKDESDDDPTNGNGGGVESDAASTRGELATILLCHVILYLRPEYVS